MSNTNTLGAKSIGNVLPKKILIGAAVLLVSVLAIETWMQTRVEYATGGKSLPALPTRQPVLQANNVTLPLVFQLSIESDQPVAEVVEPKVDPKTQAEYQRQQQGLLSRLYIDDKVYRLSAVVNEGQLTSVLAVSLVSGEPQKHIALTKGEQLGPYQLDKINHKSIELSDGDRQVSLRLFHSQTDLQRL